MSTLHSPKLALVCDAVVLCMSSINISMSITHKVLEQGPNFSSGSEATVNDIDK